MSSSVPLSPASSRLTIGIPTFDRPQRLAESVGRLLPQLGPDDVLLVLDNASRIPAAEVVAPLLANFPGSTVRIVRHRVNLGGAANILRVVEEADEDAWLWLLGDDDDVLPDAVARVRRTIAVHPDVMFINFAADNHVRSGDRVTTGLSEFIAGIDSWSNLNFMSVDVLKVEAVKPELRRGYHFAYSMSPHVAMVMSAIGATGRALFSATGLLERHDIGGWAPTLALVGRPTLLDLTPDRVDRSRLADRLRRETNLEFLTTYLVAESKRSGRQTEAVYLIDQLRGRLYGPGAPCIERLKLLAYRSLIRFPAFGQMVIGAALRIRLELTGRSSPVQSTSVGLEGERGY